MAHQTKEMSAEQARQFDQQSAFNYAVVKTAAVFCRCQVDKDGRK